MQTLVQPSRSFDFEDSGIHVYARHMSSERSLEWLSKHSLERSCERYLKLYSVFVNDLVNDLVNIHLKGFMNVHLNGHDDAKAHSNTCHNT